MSREIPFSAFGPAFIQNVVTAERIQSSIAAVMAAELARVVLPTEMEGHKVDLKLKAGPVRARATALGRFQVQVQIFIDFQIWLIGNLVERYRIRADVPFDLEVQTWAPLLLFIIGRGVQPSAVQLTVVEKQGGGRAWSQAAPKFQEQVATALSGPLSKGQTIDVLGALAKLGPVAQPLLPKGRIEYDRFGTEFLRHALSPARLQRDIAAGVTPMSGSDRVGPASVYYTAKFRAVQVIPRPGGVHAVNLQLAISLEIVILRLYKESFEITATIDLGLRVRTYEPVIIGITFDPVQASNVALSKVTLSKHGVTWNQVEPQLKTQIVNAMARSLAPRMVDVAKMVGQAMPSNGLTDGVRARRAPAPSKNAASVKAAVARGAAKKAGKKKTAVGTVRAVAGRGVRAQARKKPGGGAKRPRK